MHKFVITQHPKDITIVLSDELFEIIESERGEPFPVDDDFTLDSWLKFDDALVFSNTLNSLNESSEDYDSLKTIVSHLEKRVKLSTTLSDTNNKP